MSQLSEDRADGDFSRARTRELLGRISQIMNPSSQRLLPLEEVISILKPSNEKYAGMRSVPVDLIVGSEGRYRDFNRHFLPKRDHLRSRWVSIDKAQYEDIILPPVRLYEIGGVYFVRDGNHRVSVAKLRGQMAIDAEVSTLDSEIDIAPGMALDDIKAAVIKYEKRLFFLKTEYDLLTGDSNLDFSTPGRYDTILEHILVHKYYLNQNRPDEMDFGEALWSWHENVYRPIILAIEENGLLGRFPGRTPSDLYVFISNHWNELKLKFGLEYDIGDAARDYDRHFGTSFPDRFRKTLSGIKKKIGKIIRKFFDFL